MPESIRLDIVDLDDGYHAFYVDGLFVRESGEHLICEVIELVDGKHVASITYRCADKYANGEDELPEKYEDIQW
jgi:hypothetical protein